eukprot:494598-Rhodomonas_salina.3
MNHSSVPPNYDYFDNLFALEQVLLDNTGDVDGCFDHYCNPELQSAKLDLQLAKGCRFSYWMKDWLGDSVSVVDKHLLSEEKHSEMIEFQDRINCSLKVWNGSYTTFISTKRNQDYIGDFSYLAHFATKSFLVFVSYCKDYAEWSLKTLPHALTPEAVQSIKDVISLYETLCSQVSTEVQSVENKGAVVDVDADDDDGLLLWRAVAGH